MSLSAVSSAISSAITAASNKEAYSILMADKALDIQKQQGEAALTLIASATGKGQHVDRLA